VPAVQVQPSLTHICLALLHSTLAAFWLELLRLDFAVPRTPAEIRAAHAKYRQMVANLGELPPPSSLTLSTSHFLICVHHLYTSCAILGHGKGGLWSFQLALNGLTMNAYSCPSHTTPLTPTPSLLSS
jgi:hypothetical protein